MSREDRDALTDAVNKAIDLSKDVVSIAPDLIAVSAMRAIAFEYELHNVGWYGCYQHILQLARGRLRGRYDLDARAQAYQEDIQGTLFEDVLQDRYPRMPRRNPDGAWAEPEYVLRAYLNEEDRWFNIDRLRDIAAAARKHANALEAETVRLFGQRPDAIITVGGMQ